jgi:hypothetical protein
MNDQDERFKTTIMSAVATGLRRYREHGGEVSDAESAVKHVTAAVNDMLTGKGMGLADAAVKMKMEQLERELTEARQGKNKMAQAHKMLAIRLGIWGKKDSTLPGEAWYIWVEREPAWKGYLPQQKHQTWPITEEEFKGHVYSTLDLEKTFSLVSKEAAQECIDTLVHPYLRPYCTPTQRRE